MHELVLECWRAAPAGSVLARWPLDDGVLLALFAAGGGVRWVAKTAAEGCGVRRLRAEAEALAWLEPWANTLAVPRLLGWYDARAPVPSRLEEPPAWTRQEYRGTGTGGRGRSEIGQEHSVPAEVDRRTRQCCLIQSGMNGTHPAWSLSPAHPFAPLPGPLLDAARWLERFQRLVQPPVATTAAVAEGRTYPGAGSDAGPERWSDWLLDRAGPVPRCGGVAAHGDFWSGNLLVRRDRAGRLGVVDWSSFGVRNPLDDLCTMLLKTPCRRGRPCTAAERLAFCFFQPGRPRTLLRSVAARCRLSPPAARHGFYAFLARRLRWELGCEMQTRSRAECDAARTEWRDTLAWLERHGAPDPFGGASVSAETGNA